MQKAKFKMQERFGVQTSEFQVQGSLVLGEFHRHDAFARQRVD